MADFDSYSDVTTLQATDKLLLLRSGGGLNVTVDNLFRNMPGTVLTGLGVSTGSAAIEVGHLRTGDGASLVDLHGTAGTDYETRIIRNGGVDGSFQITNTGIGDFNLYQTGAGIMRFFTAAAERMRIDAAGLVGIGTTAPAVPLHTVGQGRFARSGSPQQYVRFDETALGNFLYSHCGDAAIKSFIIDATTDEANTGSNPPPSIILRIKAADRYLFQDTGMRPGVDNSLLLGSGSFRWSVVYAVTGTINTSDEREKVWRGAMTEAEMRAARRIIDELGFFQWKDAVAEKGADGARLHFGPRAQRVWAIMADEELVDPIGKDGRPGRTPYAFLCFDAWEAEYRPETRTVKRRERVPVEEVSTILDPKGGRARKTKYRTVEVEEEVETGRQILVREAGDRFGLRVDQLTLFLLAAQAADLAAERARNDAIEARLAALETA